MPDNDDVFAHFNHLKSKKLEFDAKSEAAAARARVVQEKEENEAEAQNKKYHSVLNNVVINRLKLIKENLKDDVTLQITPHVPEKSYKYGTGITVLFKEANGDQFEGRKTSLYYLKIKMDGHVEVERNSGASRNENLTKQIGSTTADIINDAYVDKFVNLITTEWFEAVRLGL